MGEAFSLVRKYDVVPSVFFDVMTDGLFGCSAYKVYGQIIADQRYLPAGQRAVLAAGGNLSHHHGVGLNRARFVPDALGGAMRVFQSMKDALDPKGILNPGKMGLRTSFGKVEWP